jgi:SPX domain protein involved in polyphosphate accumulation
MAITLSLRHPILPHGDPPVFERKFVGEPSMLAFTLNWLQHVCIPDSTHTEAVIMSLYYDTPGLASYFEKLDGDTQKTKYRLRWYLPDNSPDADSYFAYMEIKSKLGDGRNKVRTRLTANRRVLHSADVEHPWFMDALHEANRILNRPMDASLMPMAVIHYRRYRFICPETLASISLDSEISVDRYNTSRLTPVEPLDIPALVLEIKDQKRCNPAWLTPLLEAGFVGQGFSKYAECINRMMWEG